MAKSFTRQADPPSGKVPQDDGNYLDPGPDPFVCGNCRYIVWGGGEHDLCQIIEGDIHASGACRFFAHKEDKRADAVETGESIGEDDG